MFKKRTWIILLCGMTVGLLSMAIVVGAAGASAVLSAAQATAVPGPGAGASPKDCAECHLNINTAWETSSHAHAFDDPGFAERWTSLGKPGECLACHTTNYQSTTNSFSGEGVQCEACHGRAVEGHPPAVVPVRTDSEYCGVCHTTTLGEWRLTGHSTAGVGCMSCHDPHSQGALFDEPDDMCLNCHRDEMGEYLEDLHIQKGIGCVDCHALVIPPDPLPIDGIVPTGHAFTITTSTCVACHTDALHAGFSLPGYEHGAKAANGEAAPAETPVAEKPPASAESISPEQRIQALEAALASTRFSMLFQGGIIGLVLGGLTVYYLSRNQARKPEEVEAEQPVADTRVADGEVVDQELEKALVLIERGMEKGLNILKKGGEWMKSKSPSRKKGKSDESTDDSSPARKGS